MVFKLKTYIMENENVRIATPEEAKENKRKQRIMLNHGINVKVDGSWGT